MTRSFVIRLVSEALGAGRIAGRVEAVETGEVCVVSDADELVAFLVRRPAVAAESPGPGQPEDGAGADSRSVDR